jgi:hypothetical protein
MYSACDPIATLTRGWRAIRWQFHFHQVQVYRRILATIPQGQALAGAHPVIAGSTFDRALHAGMPAKPCWHQQLPVWSNASRAPHWTWRAIGQI